LTARLLFFAGKGGVGKTTCAAARAIIAASSSEARTSGERVLVVSTDPAHSLSDTLGVRLTARPHAVWRDARRGPPLQAVELDAPRAFARWLFERRSVLSDILERGTWLDREDIDALLDLSMPGVDELVGLIELASLARSGAYSLIVVDTAPTGHMLRLLAAPRTVGIVASALDALQRDHRLMRQRFARAGAPDAADRLIAMLAAQAEEAGALLRDARRTQFSWVLLPEELSVAESEDGMAAIVRAQMAIADVVVNRVTPPGPPCPICDRRRADERRLIATLPARLGSGPVRVVASELREPRGRALLVRIGRQLTAAALPHRRRSAGTSAMTGEIRLSVPPGVESSPPESLAFLRGARLLLFGGKGGVGKTTCAAAAALRLARSSSARRYLLLSTDPAHSLADVFRTPIGDRDRALPGGPDNLRVRELDAIAALASRRARIASALEEIAEAVGADGILVPGESGIDGLLDLAPPGIDELLGVISVIEARRDYDTIIVDTAPTGHTLRLLEMPGAAREWLETLMRVLLKYRDVIRPGTLAAELVDLSRSVRRLRELLQQPVDSRFIVVTRAAAVPRFETARLLRAIGALRLAAPAIVCNALTLAPGRCRRCRAIQAVERLEIQALRRALSARAAGHAKSRAAHECAIILTPLAAPPPRGIAALERWACSWSSWSHTNRVPTSTASSRTAARRH
jgi:arsenite-transporting ATPase